MRKDNMILSKEEKEQILKNYKGVNSVYTGFRIKNNTETDLLPLIHRFLSILYWNPENKNLLHQILLFSKLFLQQKLKYHLF